jgi:hypothetical protein
MVDGPIGWLAWLVNPRSVSWDMLCACFLVEWNADGQESVRRELWSDGGLSAVVSVKF